MTWLDIAHRLIGAKGHDIAWWQMSLRAVVVFAFGLALVRLLCRRAFGEQTPLGIMLAIIMGSNLSRTLTGNAPLGPTLAATAALAAAFWLCGQAAARSRILSRLIKGRPIWLMQDGSQDTATMRRAGVGDGDMEEAARVAGVGGMGKIGAAVLERNGKITTIRKSETRDSEVSA